MFRKMFFFEESTSVNFFIPPHTGHQNVTVSLLLFKMRLFDRREVMLGHFGQITCTHRNWVQKQMFFNVHSFIL
jgi:hypothetical protein